MYTKTLFCIIYIYIYNTNKEEKSYAQNKNKNLKKRYSAVQLFYMFN